MWNEGIVFRKNSSESGVWFLRTVIIKVFKNVMVRSVSGFNGRENRKG